jgi:hypothetical protein
MGKLSRYRNTGLTEQERVTNPEHLEAHGEEQLVKLKIQKDFTKFLSGVKTGKISIGRTKKK